MFQEKEFSSGFLASASANKKSATDYINRLTTEKASQAGWSPKQAQQWAMKQVSNFKTEGLNGKINSFKGKELAQKFDEDKHLKDAVDSVKKEISQTALRYIEVGGLPEFKRAYEQGKITKVDFDKVMETILIKSSTNPDLLASLEQQAFFTGEKTPLDMGHFTKWTTKNRKDSKGNDLIDAEGNPITYQDRSFIPGDSRFGRKAVGYAYAGSYVNKEVTNKILNDTAGYDMVKNGYNAKAISKVVSFYDGEVIGFTPKTIEEVNKTNDDYKIQVEEYMANANARKKHLTGANPTMDLKDLNNLIQNDPDYNQAIKNYTESTVKQQNAEQRIKRLNEEVYLELDDHDRSLIDTKDLIEKHEGDVFAAAKEVGVVAESDYEEWSDSTDEGKRIKYEESLIRNTKKSIAALYGNKLASGRHASTMDVDARIGRAISNRDGFIQDNIDAEEKSFIFKGVNVPESSKYAGTTGEFIKIDEKNFNTSMSQLAFGGSTVEEYLKSEGGMSALGGDDGGEGYDFKKSYTIDGFDNDGNHYSNIVIRNNGNNRSVSIQVVDNKSDDVLRTIANDLKMGTPSQKIEGRKLEANIGYMRSIKQSGLKYSKSGKMIISLGNGISTSDVTYERVVEGASIDENNMQVMPDGERKYLNKYLVKLKGQYITIGDRKELNGEQEIAIALHDEVKEYNLELRRQQSEQE